MRVMNKAVLLFIFAALLYGCAALNTASVIESIRTVPDGGTYVEGVPFYPNKTQMCGPSALASVIGFYRKGKEPKGFYSGIVNAVYSKKLKGTLAPDMLIYVRKAGFRAKFYFGGFDDLKKRLDAGSPLILFINLGLDIYPVGHYVVVTGYSNSKRVLIAHSGLNKDKVFTYAEIERAWKKTGYSTLYITPATISTGKAE